MFIVCPPRQSALDELEAAESGKAEKLNDDELEVVYTEEEPGVEEEEEQKELAEVASYVNPFASLLNQARDEDLFERAKRCYDDRFTEKREVKTYDEMELGVRVGGILV